MSVVPEKPEGLARMYPQPDGVAPWQTWATYVGPDQIAEMTAAYETLVELAGPFEEALERAMKSRVPIELCRAAMVTHHDIEDEVIMHRSGYQRLTDILINLSDACRVAAGEGPDYGHVPDWSMGVMTFDDALESMVERHRQAEEQDG